jgi:cobalt-zinc-cadmium efflux system membrane fusion protein
VKRAVAIAALAALVTGCGEQKPSTPTPPPARDPLAVHAPPGLLERLTLGRVAEAEVRSIIQVAGRVEADETRVARVGSPVTGRIVELEVLEGQTVKRGQVLATLTSTELSAAQLAYLKARSQQVLAESSAARARQLYQADVIGQAELQRRESELLQANAELSGARDQLKVLGMPARAIERLGSTRQVDSAAQVVSSIAGTVLDRTVTAGQVVQPADKVYVVADLSNVWLVADVPEQSAGALAVGKRVRAEIPALPGRPIEGALSFVSATVNPDTRTVRVRMDVPNPSGEYKPAMLATMLLEGPPAQRVVVPSAAIVREDNRDHVFVQTAPDAFVLRRVALGGEQAGARVVNEGVRVGEPIVVDGAFHLNNERKRLALQAN